MNAKDTPADPLREALRRYAAAFYREDGAELDAAEQAVRVLATKPAEPDDDLPAGWGRTMHLGSGHPTESAGKGLSATLFPMNVYLRDEKELAAFVQEQLNKWIGETQRSSPTAGSDDPQGREVSP